MAQLPSAPAPAIPQPDSRLLNGLARMPTKSRACFGFAAFLVEWDMLSTRASLLSGVLP